MKSLANLFACNKFDHRTVGFIVGGNWITLRKPDVVRQLLHLNQHLRLPLWYLQTLLALQLSSLKPLGQLKSLLEGMFIESKYFEF